jgi:voltage-gated potassium channel
LFLGAYAWPILDPGLHEPWHHICQVVDYTTWTVFLVDYITRLWLAQNRLHYWSRHLPDMAVLALPVLRPLRLLRLIVLLRVLNRRAADSLRGRVAIYVGGAAVLMVFCAALAALDAERHARGANITTFPDALWWAVATVCTVGYGDRFPVTTEGRAIATGLMLGGIAILGVVTASFASWLVERVRTVEVDAQAVTRRDLAEVLVQLDAVNERLAALQASIGSALAS